ncbi:MAG: c-type cytochrome domain-containing protein, partial [Rubripirellula sp.]
MFAVLLVAASVAFGQQGLRGADPVDAPLHASGEALTQFLGKWCLDCHGPDLQESGLRFDTLTQQWDDPQVAGQWRKIEEQVLFREMPPDGNDAADAVERMQFIEAVEAQLQSHGNGFGLAEKMLLPEYGNLLDHDSLFSGQVKDRPFTSARLWRQRPEIYRKMWGPHYGQQHWISVKIGGGNQATARNRVQHGPHKGKSISKRYFANEKFANPFFEYVHRASGITDYASIMADQASLEALLTNAESMAEILTLGLPVTVVTEVKNKDSRHGNNHGSFVGGVETISHERRGKIPIAFHRIIETQGDVSESEFRHALHVAFNLFLRREPSKQDVDHYWHKVFKKNAELGNTTALQAMLIYIAISPEFVYRMETGLTEPDDDGRRFLSPHELVGAIHYAFHNTPAFGVDEFETIEKYTKNSDPLVKNALTQEQVRRHARHGWLVERMNAGELETREDVEKVVREILGARSRNLNPNHNSDIDSV